MTIPKTAIDIINKLEAASYEAYFVGGCVRDMLMGIEPKDFDITTNATPEQIKGAFRRTVDTGIKHGTVTVLAGDESYEVTTYRLDGEYLNFRHPEQVIYTNELKEDLKRRDFTVNAIAYHPQRGYIDFFGGKDDIEAKIIRGVGDAAERFTEDALRMLRAVRFACQLDFDIEKGTFSALVEKAELISHVSMERIRDEIIKAFTSEYVEKAEYFMECEILDYALPFMRDYLRAHLEGFLKCLGELPKDAKDTTNVLSILFKDMSGEDITKNLRLLKMDNATMRDVLFISQNMYEEIKLDEYNVKKMISQIGMDNYFALLECKAACGEDVESLKSIGEQVTKRAEPIFLKDLSINGNVIMEKFGVQGVKVGEILGALHDEVLREPQRNSEAKLLEIVGRIVENSHTRHP